MDSLCLQRLEPDLRMLMEELKMKGVSCRLGGQILKRQYQGARLYTSAASLREDLLYVMRPEDTGRFPADAYPYLITVPVPGMAEHLFCPGEDPVTVLVHLLYLFSRIHQLEL